MICSPLVCHHCKTLARLEKNLESKEEMWECPVYPEHVLGSLWDVKFEDRVTYFENSRFYNALFHSKVS